MQRAEKRWLLILATVAVAFNVITLSPLVPWQRWMVWSSPEPVQEFHISVSNYTFTFPPGGIHAPVGQPVRFVATSHDVTYGFGVFRKDGGMVFQMQVIPGYENSIVWVFDATGRYDVRSTEYSGPLAPTMFVPDAIEVV